MDFRCVLVDFHGSGAHAEGFRTYKNIPTWRFGQSAEVIALICIYLSIYLPTHPKYYAHSGKE